MPQFEGISFVSSWTFDQVVMYAMDSTGAIQLGTQLVPMTDGTWARMIRQMSRDAHTAGASHHSGLGQGLSKDTLSYHFLRDHGTGLWAVQHPSMTPTSFSGGWGVVPFSVPNRLPPIAFSYLNTLSTHTNKPIGVMWLVLHGPRVVQ